MIGHNRSFDIVGEIADNPPEMCEIKTKIRRTSVESAQGTRQQYNRKLYAKLLVGAVGFS
ncbi:hypothetical protein WL61_16365 [Burkholderia ubonensis]|nr:hypothetical protein WK14_25235 [Burkholderia ubonensis]KWD22104.1 hypothetical protein WL61_16365 [Burkholderia ubonensis]OJB21211.1 hypothetical protein BGV53_02710 [Burkholderia ubonensis]